MLRKSSSPLPRLYDKEWNKKKKSVIKKMEQKLLQPISGLKIIKNLKTGDSQIIIFQDGKAVFHKMETITNQQDQSVLGYKVIYEMTSDLQGNQGVSISDKCFERECQNELLELAHVSTSIFEQAFQKQVCIDKKIKVLKRSESLAYMRENFLTDITYEKTPTK